MTQSVKLYLGQIPPNTDATEIKNLLNKISSVESIYIPPPTPTGILRNFAMVKVHPTSNFQKLVSSLNNSTWKGSKIRLEIASEYFQDKLNREKLDTLRKMEQIKSYKCPEIVYPNFNDTKIRLLKSRYANKVIEMSTKPIMESKNKSKSRNIMACKKIIFDESGHILNSEELTSDNTIINGTSHDSDFQDNMTPNSSNSIKDVMSNSKSTSAIGPMNTTSSSTLSADYKGGGIRRGFGTLTTTTTTTTTTTASSSSTMNSAIVESYKFSSTQKDLKSIDNNQSHIQEGIISKYEIDNDDENEVPCIQPEELTIDALEAERKRSLSLLTSLLHKNTSKNDTNIINKNTIISSSSDVKKSGTLMNDSMNTNMNKNKKQKIDTNTQDISSDMKEDNNDKNENNKDNNKKQQQQQQPFVNLNSFKEIYYREGGIWWEDDTKPKGAVIKGEDAEDIIFREAEKLGLDIRPTPSSISTTTTTTTTTTTAITTINASINNIDNITNNNINSSNSMNGYSISSSSSSIGEIKRQDDKITNNKDNNNNNNNTNTAKSMTFGFFDFPEEPSSSTNSNTIPITNSNLDATSNSHIVLSSSSSSSSSGVDNKDYNDDDDEEERVPILTIQDIARVAFIFSRGNQSIESITEHWRSTKDKMSLDYKRKRREARKQLDKKKSNQDNSRKSYLRGSTATDTTTTTTTSTSTKSITAMKKRKFMNNSN